MADDDDDVRGASGAEELFAPAGPRRSNFTPPPNDAESLEAAANLFNDDAIAAALAAELSRVATGAIHLPQPEASPRSAQPEPVPSAPVAPPVSAAPPIATPPIAAPAPAPGPPDWATPLFGQPPPPPASDAPVEPRPSDVPVEPAPSRFEPSPFAPPPAQGAAPVAPLPPTPAEFPSDDTLPTRLPTGAEDPLRALYLGAPAPTVPAADAPPPPGYEAPVFAPPPITPVEPGGSRFEPPVADAAPTIDPTELRPRRRSLADDELLRAIHDEGDKADTLSAIEQLQAQLDLREREAREYAAWESSMLALGTPEALAAVEQARAELASEAPTVAPVPPAVPSAPPAPEPVSFEPQPFARFAPPTDDPSASFVPPAGPPPLVEPPLVEPPLVEPPAPVDGVAELYRSANAMSSVPSAPAPAAIPQPTGQGFDELLGGTGEPNPSAPTSAWDATAPAPDGAETDARRPFGDGVERDDAVDPSDSIFGTSAIPVSVNTQGIAVAAEPVSLESRPILVQPGQPLEAPEDGAISLHPPLVVPAEPVGSEPAPLEQRVGRSVRLFWVWFAVNSSIAAVIFGAIIFALGVNLRQAIVATLAGVALSFIPLGLGTLVGKRSGQPTMVVSRATFGVVGNILPVLIALVSRLFWAGALLWILGAGAADLLVGARLTDGFTRDQLTAVSIAVGFIVAVVIAYFGYALIVVFQLVVTIVSSVVIIGFVALTYQYVDLGTALATPDGPWILVVTGAVMVFSFVGLAWANGSSDVARYQRVDSSGAGAMLSATFGAAIPTFVLVGYGALLAASNASLAANIAADPLDSLGRLLPVWYPAPLIAGTVLSLLAGVTISLYSGGFALQATGLRLRRSLSTILIGVLALVVALVLAVSLTSLSELFRDFATTVAVPVAAWAGIFGAEVMLRKRRFDSPSLLRRGGVYADARWGNLLALVVIAVIGFGFTTATVPWLSWEGYLFGAIGVPLSSQLAASDVGVLVALLLGIVFPLVAGIPGVRKQEKAIRRVG